MTPAAGDFLVFVNLEGAELECPICNQFIRPSNFGGTIRDLIAAASDHARRAHPVNERYGYACRGVSEIGY